MDKVDRKKVVEFEAALQAFAKTKYADFLKQVNEKPELSKENDAGFKKIAEDFLATGAY